MKQQNIILIGTSHIAKESVKNIQNAFEKYKPDIVAIELDERRLIGLLDTSKKKERISLSNIKQLGVQAYVLLRLGHWAEHKLGKTVGMKPGIDMLTAYKIAKKENKKVALIDQDITITLKRLSKSITWKEKWEFVKDLWRGFVLRKKDDELMQIDLTKVPENELILRLMKRVKTKYPNVYRVLVHERNVFMAKKISELAVQFPESTIVGVVGAGHKDEMEKLIEKTVLTMKKNIPKQSQDSNSISYNFSIDAN
ncbi:MAG: TraB domain-containing protein [Candidatus Woesearchaeota archaeon]